MLQAPSIHGNREEKIAPNKLFIPNYKYRKTSTEKYANN